VHSSPRNAETVRIRTPASENRRVSGGAIGDADLGRDKAETPKQAEQADIDRQRI
jgi:hypothetical protein